MSKIKNKSIKILFNTIGLTIGTIIVAIALELFLIPNTILDGGITGISILLYKQFHIPLYLLVVAINIPFIYMGYRNLGRNFLIRTIYSMASFALFLKFFEIFSPVTEEILLATSFGGALLGFGVGLVIHFGGCVDGTESVAIIISKKTNLSIGQIILIFNLIIYSIAGIMYGIDRALYSLLTYFITYHVIDYISEGLQQVKAALIITEKGTTLSKEIYNRLGRTTTTIKGKGLISGDKEVLYCVLTRIEIYELRHIVEEMDESAFVTISDVSDIIGNHIKSYQRKKRG